MNHEQTARALLRLYPAAWRERYGEELLALIAESGLTFRVVLDVVFAAAVEWLRTAAFLIQNDQLSGEPPPKLITPRYMCADFLPSAIILGTTMAGLWAAGVPPPPWHLGAPLLFQCNLYNFMAPRLRSRTARLFIWSYWLFLALALTAVAGLLASGLRLVGVPEPSEAVFMGSLGVVFVVGLIRAIPMRYKLMSYNSTWPGLDPREIRFWQSAWFAVAILFAMVEHSPKMFWPTAGILWLALRPPYGLTRESIAQQRALKEERDRESPWGQI